MEASVRIKHDAYQSVDELWVKEGEREMMVLAGVEHERLEFFYYHIRAWQYPHQDDVFTDEDRARLTAHVVDHYTAKGWRIEVDRRKFCPRCGEKLAGSEHNSWSGCICGFCGREVDQHGDIPLDSYALERVSIEVGYFERIKNRVRQAVFGQRSGSPPPDFSQSPLVPDGKIKEVSYSDSKRERAIISVSMMDTYKVYIQWWDTSGWSAGRGAFWSGQDRCGFSATLEGARRIAREGLKRAAGIGV